MLRILITICELHFKSEINFVFIHKERARIHKYYKCRKIYIYIKYNYGYVF